MRMHYAGELAYYDTFSGLVPCKVNKVMEGGTGQQTTSGLIAVTLTADRGAYRRGEEIHAHARDIIPREHVRTRSGKYTVHTGYYWSTQFPAPPRIVAVS